MTWMYDSGFQDQVMGRMDDAFGPVQKSPATSVNYRESEDQSRSCLTCQNFMGDDNTCRVVEGNVSAGGVCDEHTPVMENPEGEMETDEY